ncbi:MULTISPECIES: hypothetical protein [unclassified Variovorax]|uniref:hypothetical protein n=1 Tax=unclassified Variovorax TaxID=663243 RepID=UPI0013167563|nr:MULTISPECIES: hypothetical protein [unclassified Variovorax]VTU42559.1 hypothetical protein H6P1_00221 [Variovorax sp. PBL-H6]VTU43847.1 hypothetical protein SRS16P1_00682 [Variovorax sp. SRS16]VTU43911.1 hypothetical protein E5P1_00675 [Variovorax sp. PBL-E5]
MSKAAPQTSIDSGGLRYRNKTPGSPFAVGGNFGSSTMSCFKCGTHRNRSLLQSKQLLGRTHFVCAPSCKALAEAAN